MSSQNIGHRLSSRGSLKIYVTRSLNLQLYVTLNEKAAGALQCVVSVKCSQDNQSLKDHNFVSAE